MKTDAAWIADAACRGKGPSMFFPERHEPSQMAKARLICDTCPVKSECLNDSLEHNDRWGIWGGLSEKQRRKIRKVRHQRGL